MTKGWTISENKRNYKNAVCESRMTENSGILSLTVDGKTYIIQYSIIV